MNGTSSIKNWALSMSCALVKILHILKIADAALRTVQWMFCRPDRQQWCLVILFWVPFLDQNEHLNL